MISKLLKKIETTVNTHRRKPEPAVAMIAHERVGPVRIVMLTTVL